MSGYIGTQPVPQATQTRQTFVATAAQTSFATAGFTPQFVDVYLNGIKLTAEDYVAENGSDIVLTVGAAAGDTLEVVAYTAFEVLDQTFTGTTTVTDSGAAPLVVNRTTSDGDIIDLLKDGTSVGSIGTDSGFTYYTGGSGSGVKMKNAAVVPTNGSGVDADGTESLGQAATRWSNLYLSGTAYVGSKVGIGTAAPSSILHIEGSTPVLRIKATADTEDSIIHFADTSSNFAGVISYAHNGNAMKFYTSQNERMRITSSGNVLVGTTSSVPNSLGYNCRIVAQTAAGVAGLHLAAHQTTVTTMAAVSNGNGQVGSITATGSATAYNTSSDYRLKDNITPIQGAADIVKAMQPVTYNFKADSTDWHDGFLAHELQELHPRAVIGSKDAMRDEEYEVTPAVEATYDAEGVELTPAVPAVMGTRSVPDYQGVDYSKLTPILTAALKEALNKIDALEARLTALEVTP